MYLKPHVYVPALLLLAAAVVVECAVGLSATWILITLLAGLVLIALSLESLLRNVPSLRPDT